MSIMLEKRGLENAPLQASSKWCAQHQDQKSISRERSHIELFLYLSLYIVAIAEAVEEWQKLKEEGKLEGQVEEEEDIYAEARMVDVSVQ